MYSRSCCEFEASPTEVCSSRWINPNGRGVCFSAKASLGISFLIDTKLEEVLLLKNLAGVRAHTERNDWRNIAIDDVGVLVLWKFDPKIGKTFPAEQEEGFERYPCSIQNITCFDDVGARRRSCVGTCTILVRRCGTHTGIWLKKGTWFPDFRLWNSLSVESECNSS
jgi:hypothetical protein